MPVGTIINNTIIENPRVMLERLLTDAGGSDGDLGGGSRPHLILGSHGQQVIARRPQVFQVYHAAFAYKT